MLTAPIVTSGRFSVKQLCNTARQRLSGINQETPETQKDVREFCMTKHAMYALHMTTTTFSSETVHRDKRRQVTMILHLFGSWICIQKIFVRTIDHYGGFDAGSFMTCSRFDLSFLDLWIFMAWFVLSEGLFLEVGKGVFAAVTILYIFQLMSESSKIDMIPNAVWDFLLNLCI